MLESFCTPLCGAKNATSWLGLQIRSHFFGSQESRETWDAQDVRSKVRKQKGSPCHDRNWYVQKSQNGRGSKSNKPVNVGYAGFHSFRKQAAIESEAQYCGTCTVGKLSLIRTKQMNWSWVCKRCVVCRSMRTAAMYIYIYTYILVYIYISVNMYVHTYNIHCFLWCRTSHLPVLFDSSPAFEFPLRVTCKPPAKSLASSIMAHLCCLSKAWKLALTVAHGLVASGKLHDLMRKHDLTFDSARVS